MVKVFSSDSCMYCVKLKRYLQEKNIPFEVIDVNEGDNARELLSVSGQMGIPVSIIDDKVIIGFDKAAIDSALGI